MAISNRARPEVSIVIPAYNSSASLAELVERLTLVLEPAVRGYEILFINDGSTDDTWSEIDRLSASNESVRGFDLLRNRGQAMATFAGLSAAVGDVVCTMDDDLQHPPEELPKLLHALRDNPGWDAAIGSWDRGRAPRGIGSQIYGVADRIAWGTPRGFRHTAFRAIRRPAVDALVAHRTVNPVIGPMLLQVAGNVHNVDVEHSDRKHGSTGYTIRTAMRHTLTNFAQGSTMPLTALAIFGACVSVVAAALVCVLVGLWAFGPRGPSGWLSVMASTLFLGGVSLLGIGLLGQYLSLVVAEVRRPPQWAFRRQVGD